MSAVTLGNRPALLRLKAFEIRWDRAILFKITTFKPGDWSELYASSLDPGAFAMSILKNEGLASITGRNEFIIAEALATALIALEQLPDARQPTRNMADMKMLLNSLYPHAEVSLHLTIARWRFIPNSRPFGA